MKKLNLLAIFILFTGAFRADAQSIHNTAWKTYITSLSDTITLHIGGDTSFVTVSTGDVVVRSIFQASGDTLTMKDFEGQYACQNGTGIYKYTIKEDKLVMKMVTDPCDGRGTAIDGIAWDKAKMLKN
jgi:hypothetical protein